jgi:hypothetical protein
LRSSTRAWRQHIGACLRLTPCLRELRGDPTRAPRS